MKGRDKLRKDLLSRIKSTALKTGNFELSSGRKSNYYIDLKEAMLTGTTLFAINLLMIDIITDNMIDFSAIGGLELGAIPLVSSLGVICASSGANPGMFIIRKEDKLHGTKGSYVGAQLLSEDRVIILDDVLTTGDSILKTAEVIRETGCKVLCAIVVVDRMEGGKEAVEAQGIKVYSLYTMSEFIDTGNIS